MSSSPWYTASVFVSPQMSQVLGKQSMFYCIWFWMAVFIPQSYANKSSWAVTFHLYKMTNTLVCDYFGLNKGGRGELLQGSFQRGLYPSVIVA